MDLDGTTLSRGTAGIKIASAVTGRIPTGSPGNGKLWGTNGSGTLGWYDIPATAGSPTWGSLSGRPGQLTAIPALPSTGSRDNKVLKFNGNSLNWEADATGSGASSWSSLSGRPAQLIAIPALPAADSRDNKVLKFDGNTLGWEADAVGSSGASAWGDLTGRPAQLIAIPALPNTGSRDNKVLKFNGNNLNWEADATGGGSTTTSLPWSSITSRPFQTVGNGLQVSSNALRVRANGTSMSVSSSGISVNSVEASKITGTLATARIPNISATKITSGRLGVDRFAWTGSQSSYDNLSANSNTLYLITS